jgi:23S rRNA (guanosine2251-2'-O)-methyltransferase
MSLLSGIHPVREALRAGRPLDRILIAKGSTGPRIQEIVDLARERKVPVRFEARELLDRAVMGASQHQGIVAFGSAERFATIEETIAAGGLHIVLDGVEDPHNLGAIVRTAAGALAYVPIVRVTNVNRSLELLKESGYWIYGLDERGDLEYDKVEFTKPTAIVLGGEGKGLHDHVSKHCDFLVRIPMPPGGVASLNVSVAAGIMLFEWRRRA